MYGNNIVWDTQNGSSVYDGQYRLSFFSFEFLSLGYKLFLCCIVL